jgi:hypothetical protein
MDLIYRPCTENHDGKCFSYPHKCTECSRSVWVDKNDMSFAGPYKDMLDEFEGWD